MLETKEYDMFKTYPGNRPIDSTNLCQLVSSISSKNLLRERPIVVNERYEVLDGQHRLQAARTLQVPIFYTVKEGGGCRDIILLNNSQRNWRQEDHLRIYSEGEKLDDYVHLKNFMDKHNLKLSIALLIVQGPFKEMKEYSDFKDGSFKFPLDEESVERDCLRLKWTLNLIKSHNIKPFHRFQNTAFVRPFLIFISDSSLNWDLFQQKIELSWFKIGTRPSTNLYIEMLADIYNFRNQNKIYFKASDSG